MNYLIFAISAILLVSGLGMSYQNADAVNDNLFVSAENPQFDNYMSGSQVIEVVIIDDELGDQNKSVDEPNVTINGNTLRMVQGVDSNWYGYFADYRMATIADSTSTVAGIGLDYGLICSATELSKPSSVGIEFDDVVAVAVPSTSCSDVVGTSNSTIMNVLREPTSVNNHSAIDAGQIGINEESWPFIQLYHINPTGNVFIQYHKASNPQNTTLTFDTVDQFAGHKLDKSAYTQGSQVKVTITDTWLNIDPTDEDSWTFGTFGVISTNYQVFDENGIPVGAVSENTDNNMLKTVLDYLMCEDNCVLVVDPDVLNKGNAITLQDNEYSEITSSNPQNPTSWKVTGGYLAGNIPITLTEQGTNNGVFGTYDEDGTSSIVITDDAKRANSATIDYNETPFTILVGTVLTNFILIDSNDTGGDCTKIGDWNAKTKTCTLSTDLNKGDSISIASDGITLDGKNHKVVGFRDKTGISTQSTENVTIKNIEISNFRTGISLDGKGHIVSDVMSHHNVCCGVYINDSTNMTVSKNNLFENNFSVLSFFSDRLTIEQNISKSNEDGFFIFSADDLKFLKNTSIDDDFVTISHGKNVTIKENKVSNVGIVQIGGITNSVVSNNIIDGKQRLDFSGGTDNTYSHNKIHMNRGLFINSVINSTFSENQIKNPKDNLGTGVFFKDSYDNYFSNNVVENYFWGINLFENVEGNVFERNKVMENGRTGFVINTNNNSFNQNISLKNQGFGFVVNGIGNNFSKNLCQGNELGGSNIENVCKPQGMK